MVRKKLALFMTVGLGGETQEKIDSLAHGMLDTIVEGNFDYVVLFGSEKSKPTIESLKRQYIEMFNDNIDDDNLDEFDYYEFVQEDNVNDFNKYYEVIRSKILELQDEYTIKINYTPGTKTMSISAAIASLVFRKTLRSIEGDRGDGPTIRSGTEKHVDFNLYVVYDEVLIRRIREYFNNGQFYSGRLLIDDLSCDCKEDYIKLFDIYSNWDNVNFKGAWDILKNFKPDFPEISAQLGINKKVLNIICESEEVKENGEVVGYRYHDYKDYYELASIINNADRKFSEKKYDDAIARLYRSFERIGQIRLTQFGIDTKNVDVKILSDNGVDKNFIDELKNKADENGNIKSGLVQDFIILSKLGDDLGKQFLSREQKYVGQVNFRNESILAHGMESKNEKEYCDFRDTVMTFARILHNKMDEFIEESKFPKF